MTDPIRTPLDESTEPGFYLPPFRESWWYQGATYPGHSNHAVDFNRRTATGGWLDDRGDPVLAAADGIVAAIEPADGTVFVNHWDGLYRTEYRHMEPVRVKKGQRVERGDRLGDIGSAGNSTSPHLHHRHWRRSSKSAPWRSVPMRFEGKVLDVSVKDSDTRPAGWSPPRPILLQGPPPKATWRSAFEESEKLRSRAERQRDKAQEREAAAVTARGAAEAALAEERAAHLLTQQSLKVAQDAEASFRRQLDECEAQRDRAQAHVVALDADLEAAKAQVAALDNALSRSQEALDECEARQPEDCDELREQHAATVAQLEAINSALAEAQDFAVQFRLERDGALARAQQEQERAIRAEDALDACETASAADETFYRAVEAALAARRAAT